MDLKRKESKVGSNGELEAAGVNAKTGPGSDFVEISRRRERPGSAEAGGWLTWWWK
jgi:hypothetical protein